MPTRRVRTGVVIIAMAVLVQGGCASDPKGSATPSGTSVTTPSSGSPTPRPIPSFVQERADAAIIAPGALAILEGPRSPSSDDSELYTTTDVCGKSIAADSDRARRSHLRTWASEGWWVRNITHAYGTTTAAVVIDQVKAAVEGCKEYEDSGDQVKVLGPVELPRYPRTEARFGFCYSTTPADGGEAYIACDAYIARDHVVSSVTVVRGDDQESSRLGVLFVGALAAEALAKVV